LFFNTFLYNKDFFKNLNLEEWYYEKRIIANYYVCFRVC
jgi:hypothetical protein